MNIFYERLERLAEQYPFSGKDILSFYILIKTYEEDKYKIQRSSNERIEILQRVMEIACIHAIRPENIINFVYDEKIMNIFHGETNGKP